MREMRNGCDGMVHPHRNLTVQWGHNMTNCVYKYPVPGPGSWHIAMPKGAQCLFVWEQDNRAFFWALVDPTADGEVRHFIAVETGGESVPAKSRYLGTAMLYSGSYVLHVFELAD
jgi:hypothetical protein